MSDYTTTVEATAPGPESGAEQASGSELSRAWSRFRHNKLAVGSLIFVLLLIVAAILAPLLAPYSYLQQDLLNRLQPSFSEGHLLGTDPLGRDVLSRLLFSLRTALIVGFGAELIALTVAIVIGMAAGYLAGRTDQVLMALTDIMFAFPTFLFAVLMVVVLGRSTFSVIVAIAVASWVGQTRVARAQVLKIKNFDYVEAARSIGTRDSRIAFRHILPNAVGPMLVTTSFGIPAAIAAEAGLSIIGLGVAPPTPSWGSMILQGYRYVLTTPHLIIWPLLLFSLTMLAFTFIGDGFRDAFDTSEEDRA